MINNFNNLKLLHSNTNTVSSLGIYHIFNKTIDKRTVFASNLYADRFMDICRYYKSSESSISYSKLPLLPKYQLDTLFKQVHNKKTFGIKIYAFSLMPTHFHFLIKEVIPGFASKFISNTVNSFTKYFNKINNNRLGPIFLKRYKRVEVFTDEQFSHLIRYVNLNNYSGGLIKSFDELENFKYCSFGEYFSNSKDAKLSDFKYLIKLFGNRGALKEFILDRAEYQKMLEEVKHTNY